MPRPTSTLSLENIQGNILGGFNKDFQANLFLQFTSDRSGRAWIKEISEEVSASSSAQVIQFNAQFSALKAKGVENPERMIAAVWVNLAFSYQGLKTLKLKESDLKKFPNVFRDGMAKRSAANGDIGPSAPQKWIAPFNHPETVHAVLIVAADSIQTLEEKVNEITETSAFKTGVKILLNQPGHTRRGKFRGREHFGFKDGISQPGVRGVNTPDDPIGNPDQGHPGQDLLWPGEFVLGYATQIPKAKKGGGDGFNPDPGPDSKSGPNWTRDGSYVVFRRLKQDVPGFNKHLKDLATSLGWSEDLTGAKLVGRYKSGAPIEKRKFQPGPHSPPSTDPGNKTTGTPALGNNPTLNNNFEFGDDPDGALCPLSAHIRKAYPRDEFTPAGKKDSKSYTQTRRLLRRGIPYGAPYDPRDPTSASIDRGLLFFCYQKDIETQFEFVQQTWVNNPDFPPKPKEVPALRGAPGEDPIIAQSAKGDMLITPEKDPVSIQHFVLTTGGEYFFSPSISTLEKIGDRKI